MVDTEKEDGTMRGMEQTGGVFSIVILLSVTMLFCNGCWDKKELNQLALAQVIAIDYSDSTYRVTLQLIIPAADNDTVTSDNLWPITGIGDSVGEAMQQIALTAPREIYLDHLDLVLLGEGVLTHDVEQGLEYLLHENVLRRRTQLLAVEGDAGKLLIDSAELAKMDIFYMENLLKDQRRRSRGTDATINAYYLSAHHGLQDTLVIPRISVESKTALTLDGACLVQQGKQLAWVDHDWLLGYYWALGGKEVMTLCDDTQTVQRQVVVELQKKPCKWEIASEEPLEIRAVMRGTIKIVSGYDSWQNSAEAEAISREIQSQVEQTARRQITATFRTAQSLGADAFHLGRWLYGWYPQLVWSGEWPKQFSQLPITVIMDTQVVL